MTLPSRALAWFPFSVLLFAAACLIRFLRKPGFGTLLLLLCALYLYPLAAFRLHQRWRPLKHGRSRLDTDAYSPWWGGHQIQSVFYALPELERMLRLVPGLYSVWLRAWGSRIGKGVQWTPAVEMGDRSSLDIGDGVIFGHKAKCYAHVVSMKSGRPVLYTAPVTIGDGAFLGIGSVVGPGSSIAPGAVVPAAKVVGVNRRFPE